MTEYTELQIIKHALEYYIQRPEATEKDVAREKLALEEVKRRVEWRKEKYGIK